MPRTGISRNRVVVANLLPKREKGQTHQDVYRERGCPWPVLSPRFWPPEVPTPRGEFSVSASLGFPPLARLFHPERLALGDDEHVVMEQSIEQADGR